jgi:hypothetical protein
VTKKGSKKTKAANDEAAPKKPKQLGLPAEGMQRKKIAEVDKAAEAYRAARDIRMKHTKTEKERKLALIEVAKKHGVKDYVYEDEDGEEFAVEYTADQKENVKVRKLDRDDGDDE